MGFTMLESSYSQYFNSISAKQLVIRTTFVLIGIFNFVGRLFSGHFLDQTKLTPIIFSLVGTIFMILPYITLGTMPYWPISQLSQQWAILATSPFLSCGYVVISISTLSRMHHMELSHVDEVDTSALISG